MKRLLAGLAVLALTGCSTGVTTYPVSAEEARRDGKEWPLTVPAGEIICGEHNRLILMVRDSAGTVTGYALNGLAESAGFADLETIWRKNPNVPGLRMTMWLTTYGVEKCGF